MKRFLIILVALLLAVGCWQKFKCNLEKSLAVMTATAVTQKLECKRGDLVLEYFKEVYGKTGLCKDEEQFKSKSALGSACSVVVPIVIDLMVMSTVDPAWECDPEATVDDLKRYVVEACSQLKEKHSK